MRSTHMVHSLSLLFSLHFVSSHQSPEWRRGKPLDYTHPSDNMSSLLRIQNKGYVVLHISFFVQQIVKICQETFCLMTKRCILSYKHSTASSVFAICWYKQSHAHISLVHASKSCKTECQCALYVGAEHRTLCDLSRLPPFRHTSMSFSLSLHNYLLWPVRWLMAFIWCPFLPFAEHQQIKPWPKKQIVPQKSRKNCSAGVGGNTGGLQRQWSGAFWPLERKAFAEEWPGTISSVVPLPGEIPPLLIYSYCYRQRQTPN